MRLVDYKRELASLKPGMKIALCKDENRATGSNVWSLVILDQRSRPISFWRAGLKDHADSKYFLVNFHSIPKDMMEIIFLDLATMLAAASGLDFEPVEFRRSPGSKFVLMIRLIPDRLAI